MDGQYRNHFARMPDERDSEENTTSIQIKHLSDKTETTVDVKEMRTSEPEWKPKPRELLIMITVSIASLVVAVDATILVPVLPILAYDLKGTAADAFWTGTSYLLAHSVLQPTMASFSDIFGRREVLLPSILFFAGGSVICALSHGFKEMLVGRVVQGVGGAGIICISQQVFADMVPLRVRPKYFTMVLSAWALGSVCGPLIGGLLVDKVSWRWCFWLNLPICGLALPMSFFLGQLSQPKKDLMTKLKSIDWSGNTIFITSLTSLLVGISWAGIQYSWTSYQTLLPLILGGIGLIGAIYFEMKISKKPFLEKSVFNSVSSIASFGCAMTQGLIVYMALYYFAFYFTATHFYSAIRTGLSLIPSTACLLPASSVTNILMARFGVYRPFIWAGFSVAAVACGCIILWNEHTPVPVWAACQCFFGAGMGMILSSVSVAIQAGVDAEFSAQAAAMYAFMRSIGMAIGVAIGGTVFQNVMKHRLVQLAVPHGVEIAQNSEGFIEHFKQLAETGPEVIFENIMSGYVHGFKGAYITMTAFCIAGLAMSALVKHNSLDRGLKSKFRVQTFHV